SAHALQLAVGADHVADYELGGKAERHRDQEHDRRMAKREEESNAQGLLPLLEQLAGGVVDGRDVVRIDRMPQAKRVGETTESEIGMTSAASSAVAKRPDGLRSRVRRAIASFSQSAAVHSVFTMLGATALTRMPTGPSWVASCRLNMMSPALVTP